MIWKHIEDTLCVQEGDSFRPTMPTEAWLIGEIERLRTALKRIRECGDVECDGVATDKVIYSADLHRQCRVIAHNALT